MSISSNNIRRTVGLAVAVALAATGSAFGLQALPAGSRVNDDLAAGIDKTVSVNGEDPTNSDVTGGALTAGKPAVPWAIFRQEEKPPGRDQTFVRSFANGTWLTRGNGTVGGRSSASPQFSGSLNFDQTREGESPAIDFAGAGRTVPWATWYENTLGTGFDHDNVFASRFDNAGDANQGKWIFGGQARGLGGGTVQVPSLNIHTNQDAENPSVAGGSAADPTKPGPWMTWQETTEAPVEGREEIFVSRPIGPGAANCDGVTPKGVEVEGHVPAIGGFCFQQTGIGRVGPGGADPSLNVDPTRNGVEPDIAFTGASDGVPWVVWYEKEKGRLGLNENEMVFAAKGIKDETAEGGFRWEAVGSGLHAVLDTSGATNKFGACAESSKNEEGCSLNRNPKEDAENPRVASGTMNPAKATVPWVAWDEDAGRVKQVFVSRLVGTGAEAHFEVVNGGAPISTGANDSTRPDITFSGNTPYVSWREETGGGATKGFTGHFVNAANPTFVLDQSDVPLTPTAEAEVREPISSPCTATPFNSDGAACQGGAVGTPFFLSTDGTSPRGLFADAYQPDTPISGASSGVSSSSATVSGAVNPEGAAVKVSFQYGTTTAYGQVAGEQSTGVSNAVTPFSAQLTGLPAGTTIHYRAVAASDFGMFVGADQTLRTASAPGPGPGALIGHAKVSSAKVSGSSASVRVSCAGAAGSTCRLRLKLTATETFKGRRLIAISAKANRRKTRKVVEVGTASVTLMAGQTRTVKIGLNATGKALLASHRGLKATLQVTQANAGGGSTTVFRLTVKFKRASRGHLHRPH
jgi:hypothetical protein